MARVALVTGGTRGIGAAISAALAGAGYAVAANYCEQGDVADAFVESTGVPIFRWDVSDFDACRAGTEAVAASLGPIDILVNNAGVTRDGTLHRMTLDDWRAVMAVNLDGVFNMSRQVIEGMRARRFGRIVNISSVNAQRGQAGQANYAAAKAAVIGFTKAVAQEGASHGITCNAVAPGYVETDMLRAVPPDILAGRILPTIPVGRLGQPEEIARCVLFLASDEASFITGSTLSVNGGQWMA